MARRPRLDDGPASASIAMRVSATQKQRLRALADRHLTTVAALLRGAVNDIALDSDDPQPFRRLGCGRRK